MNARPRDKAGFRRFFGYLEETGLVEPLREICIEHAVTLFEVYGDEKGPTAYAARLECWAWLHLSLRKSPTEIARLFDREHTSLLYALRRMREAATTMGVDFAVETARPIAQEIAGRASAAATAAGKRVAALRNADPRRCPDCKAYLRIPVHARCPSQNGPGTALTPSPTPGSPPDGESSS